MGAVYARLQRPMDLVPLALFRMAFGAVMAIGVVRFVAKGWVHALYIDPVFHFSYWGFGWVVPLPAWAMYAAFAVMGLAAVMMMVGYGYRIACAAFFVLFTYIELIDQAYYLNHYYLVSLLSSLLLWLPAAKLLSCKARARSATGPAWILFALRAQVALVYFFAGVAKLQGDWLLRAMPLRIWLAANADWPLVGPLLDLPWVPYAASWMSAALDLAAPFLLGNRRSRLPAYAALCAFHLATAALFHLGLFPWLMIACGLLFFDGSDYRRLLACLGVQLAGPTAVVRGPRWAPWLMVLFIAGQCLLPLRHWLYPGAARWTEEGFRYAWQVMLVEKSGHAVFTVRDPASKREWCVYPNEYLTPHQEVQMAFQPDLLLAFAHFLAAEFARQGVAGAQVRAEVFVSLNGRPPQRLVDPHVDLVQCAEGLWPKPWILPLSMTAL